MSEDKYIKKVSSNKFFRVMAWVALIVIVGLVIATFVAGVTGSEYFMGFLVLSIIVPVFVYVVLWIGRLLFNSAQDKSDSGDKQE
ncbi:MAG: hypothetical protein E7263_05190 [Lachnospiraceae bacterium]|nr:hypothetical protein [Lachnospiraceae bacterium]